MNIKVYKELFEFLKDYKKDIGIVLISLISVSLSLLFIGSLIKNFIDNGLKISDITALNHTALLMCAFIVIFCISSFFRSYYINSITEKVINKIKLTTYKNTLKLTITQFEELKIGDIVSRFDSDLDLVSKLITSFLSFFIRNSIMLIGAIILMFCQSIKLSLLVILVVPLFLIPLFKLGKFVKNLSKENLQIKSIMTSDLIETFTNIRTIHAFNKENDKIRSFEANIYNYLSSASKRLKIRSLFFALSVAIILSSIVFVIWLGSIDIIKGTMSAGQMTSFIYYSIMAAMSATSIAELFTELHSPVNSAERIFELMNLFKINNLNCDDNKITEEITIPEIIEFKDVSFFYPSRAHIKALNNISFKIHNGNFIGIIGKSGSGKSTIMQLLLKFYTPTSGVIKINNHDLSKLNTENLRNLISYVPQDPTIFAGTIKSNIIFSKPNATDEEIDHVVSITGIDNFINELENKLLTEIGERGIKLSGGQKQRIAIARALLNNPKILLLDEATSALDIEAEKTLLRSIRHFMYNNILISIAHRTSTLENANEIFIIDKGCVISIGTHFSLLKKSLYYQYICNEQVV